MGTLLETSDGGRSWRFRRSFPAGGGGPFLSAVGFLDARHGWVAPLDQRLYRTADGGRTWTRVKLPCGFVLGGVSFTDPANGYAVCGGQPATIEQLKQLYVTRDGGRSWRLVERSYICNRARCRRRGEVPTTGHAAGLLFRTAEDGLLVASRLGIYRTRDGGHNWRTTLFTDDAFSVQSVSWPTPRRLYAVLWNGGLLASDDGGRHWKQRFRAGPGRPEGPVSFSSRTNGIGAGQGAFFRNPGAILATGDGGRTWSLRTVIRGVEVQQLLRVSARVVWALGTEQLSPSRRRLAILRSRDDGRTWRRLRTPAGVTAGSLSAVSADVALLLPVQGRRLFRTTDGGRTWQLVGSRLNALSAQFASADRGLMLARDGGLLHTTDGGKTWQRARLVPAVKLISLAVLDERHWWLAGFGCARVRPGFTGKPAVCLGGKRILRTSDGGRRWETIRLRAWPGSPDFDFVTPSVGYAGNALGGGLYRTMDGGRTWRFVRPAPALP